MPTLVTSADLAGTIYSSGVNSPNHMANEGWKTFFDPLLGDLIDELNSPQTGLSSSSVTFGTGAKTFVTNTTLRLYPGGYAVAARVSNPTSAWMFGSVTAKSGTTVILDVTRLSSGLASGPYTNWALSLAAPEPVVASAVTSVSLVASSAGITVTSGLGITDVGTIKLALADDMAAVEALTSTGILDRLGTASFQIMSKGSAIQTAVLASSEQAVAAVLMARPTVVGTIISQVTSWSKPNTGTMIFVEAWGAGGGGAGWLSANSGAGGGGGGSYAFAVFPFTSISTVVLVTIGSGGTGGSSGSGGVAGGNTTFGSYLTAYGGAGGGAGATPRGGGGGGGLSAGSSITGGSPTVSETSAVDGFGGASFFVGSRGDSGFGGGAGGVMSGGTLAGNTVFGGAGGGTVTSSGVSLFGGNGGIISSGAGTTPSVGGGGNSAHDIDDPVIGGDGGRGEVRIWVI